MIELGLAGVFAKIYLISKIKTSLVYLVCLRLYPSSSYFHVSFSQKMNIWIWIIDILHMVQVKELIIVLPHPLAMPYNWILDMVLCLTN